MDCCEKIENKNILVIGDVMLDIYYHGAVERISPEAPVPVFLAGDITYRLGGAANVAVNMAANYQSVAVLSVIGKDENGEILKSLFRTSNIHTEYLMETERPTTMKCRLLAGGNQQVLRIDSEDVSGITEDLQEKILQTFSRRVGEFDMIVLSDYMKGFLVYEFTRKIIAIAKQNGIRVLVDVKDKNAEKYKGVYMLKPNRKELGMLTGMRVRTMNEVREASEVLCRECECDYVLTTCGVDGMLLVDRTGVKKELKTAAQEVFDVTGAGDTVIAYMAMCLANGTGIEKAMLLANYAAGLQVSKTGTSIVYMEEVKKISQFNDGKMQDKNSVILKNLEIDELEEFRKQNSGKKIVFTNGCFDILHIGHIRYLKEAAQLGDLLVVGLNSDDSVRRLKGLERPINPQDERMEILASLEYVDYLIIFEEDTPLRVIEACQPDVLVKGGDYQVEGIVGREIVEKRGGTVKVLPFVEGKSTTGLIRKIVTEKQILSS